MDIKPSSVREMACDYIAACMLSASLKLPAFSPAHPIPVITGHMRTGAVVMVSLDWGHYQQFDPNDSNLYLPSPCQVHRTVTISGEPASLELSAQS